MRGRTILFVAGGGCLAAVAVVVVLLLLGMGGGLLYWWTADGSVRRAAASAEIDRTLRVTVERATREGAAGQGRERLTCRVRVENLGDRDVAAFSGALLFSDDKGWTVFSCGVRERRPIAARESATVEEAIECFAYTPSSGSLDGVDPTALTPAWLPDSLELADGTRVDVFPEQP